MSYEIILYLLKVFLFAHKLKQIQRLAFQRLGSQFDSASNGILTLAAWQAFMTASDNTKIVVTPLIGADPVIEAGEAIKNGGGDNSTLNGVPRRLPRM